MYGHISNGFLVHIESKNEKNHHFIQILEIFLSQNAIQRGAKEEVYQSKCKIEREREREEFALQAVKQAVLQRTRSKGQKLSFFPFFYHLKMM